jgi:hypothetical protein
MRVAQPVILKKKKKLWERPELQLGKGAWRAAHKLTTWRATHVEVVERKKVVGCRKVLIGKTRMKFKSASVRISYALLHLREIPRFLSNQGARGLLVFNLILI